MCSIQQKDIQAPLSSKTLNKPCRVTLRFEPLSIDNCIMRACSTDDICTHATRMLYKPCLDGILPSSVSNLRGDYHNPLPAKLVHTRKINLRRLLICWKTRW